MKHTRTKWSSAALAAVGAAALALSPQAATAQDAPLKVGVVAFLTGAAAGPFGVPGRNGAETVIDAINKGALPAPYNTVGAGGRMIEAEYIDESGGNTKQVTEYRNLVEKRGVDAVVGYISSGSCQALAPVVEEVKRFTIFAVCGTPRVFEEVVPDPKYVFRTMAHATADNVAAAHYVKAKMPDISGFVGINQNYAWGQDSMRDFALAMKTLMPDVKESDKNQWPKLFAGQYGTEISALTLDKADLIHTSFWDGDLESFIFQATPRGLFQRKKVVGTVAETAQFRLGKKLPEGVALGARGPYGVYAHDTELNQWFRKAYIDRYGTPPTGPSYQYAQAVLALKIAYDKAAAAGDPTQEGAIKALESIGEFEAFGATIKMALANGHQAITESALGVTKWDDENGYMSVTDVEYYPAECIMPPAGQTSVEWLEAGMPGAKC